MELENIVANTVYIKARAGEFGKNKGRSKKWKDMLKLAPINQCLYIKNEIKLTKEYLIDSQPIGKKLFRQYCSQYPEYNNYAEFLESIERFELSETDRLRLGREIVEKYLLKRSPNYLGILFDSDSEGEFERKRTAIDEFLFGGGAESNRASLSGSTIKQLFDECSRVVEAVLYKKPFERFIDDSSHFKRYLQIKQLEKMPINKTTFRMYRVLGKGGFGEVCACQSRATGRMYACKKLEKKRIKQRKGEQMALNEKLILQKVNSRFIVNLAYAYEIKDSLCLILTLMNGGDLKFHIHHMQVEFKEDRALFYTAEIVCGLQHLHANQIVYRDLKPENILLDDTGHIRISDLGLAVELNEEGLTRGRVGTIGYMAPEVIKGDYYNVSPDWWALGCILFEMIEGNSPFRKRKEKVKREEVDRRVCEDAETYSAKFSPLVKDLCTKLLNKDPAARIGCGSSDANEIKNHPCFTFNWKRIEAAIETPLFVPDLIETGCFDELNVLGAQFEPVINDEQDDEDEAVSKRRGCFSLTKKSTTNNSTTNSESSNKPKLKNKSATDADTTSMDADESTTLNTNSSSGGLLARLFKKKTKSCSSVVEK